MSLPEERPPFEEPSSPIGRMQSGLAASFTIPSPKKTMEMVTNSLIKPFIDKRKPSSTTVERGVLNNGKHMLIPVMARMIHSSIWNSKQFFSKDGRPLHMVKLVGFWR